MTEPLRNERRFYRYPMNRVVAVMDDDQRCTAACRDLERTGVDVAGVHVLSGPEGAGLLDASGTTHGLRGRVIRLLQRGAYEGEALTAHASALQHGRSVLYVPVRGQEQTRTVVQVLQTHGARSVLNFRRWGVAAFPDASQPSG